MAKLIAGSSPSRYFETLMSGSSNPARSTRSSKSSVYRKTSRAPIKYPRDSSFASAWSCSFSSTTQTAAGTPGQSPPRWGTGTGFSLTGVRPSAAPRLSPYRTWRSAPLSPRGCTVLEESLRDEPDIRLDSVQERPALRAVTVKDERGVWPEDRFWRLGYIGE